MSSTAAVGHPAVATRFPSTASSWGSQRCAKTERPMWATLNVGARRSILDRGFDHPQRESIVAIWRHCHTLRFRAA
jgi:hypothetical protein